MDFELMLIRTLHLICINKEFNYEARRAGAKSGNCKLISSKLLIIN